MGANTFLQTKLKTPNESNVYYSKYHKSTKNFSSMIVQGKKGPEKYIGLLKINLCGGYAFLHCCLKIITPILQQN